MHNNLLPMNLQFFAEGGAEEPEVAAPVAEEGTDNVGTDSEEETGAEEPVDEPQRDLERDSYYASIRRKAEEDAKKRYDALRASENEEFKRLFGEFINPITGKPVETSQDYLQAYEAQMKEARDEELRSKGVDPALIEQMVNNSPVVREAQVLMQNMQEAQVARMMEEDVKIISETEPSIQTVEDLINHPSFGEMVQLVKANSWRLDKAYKVANMDSLMSRQTAAAKQAAINQAKGKQHMVTTNGVAEPTADLAPIPEKQLAKWRQMFPDLTLEQLTKNYNEVM